MSQANRPGSPRQKMITLMYIVLTAMLALNISGDVLDSFGHIDRGLNHTTSGMERNNAATYAALENAAATNPAKAGHWAGMGAEIRRGATDLISHIDTLKNLIARQADGPGSTPDSLQFRESTNAAAVVMLNPIDGKGRALREKIDGFRSAIEAIITDSMQRQAISQTLSTSPVKTKGAVGTRLWEEDCFVNRPAIAAITLLTKLQTDIRYAEGEALAELREMVDAGDIRVNRLNAFVIPASRNVMSGSRYSAEIVLAAIDTTSRPTIYIGGKKQPYGDGHFEQTVTGRGKHTLDGFLEVPHPDGSVSRHPFSSSYNVVEPTATVSATMMNILYTGIDNPLSISVPGIPASAISATMTNGTLTRQGDHWVARPKSIDSPAVISVTADTDNGRRQVATTEFRVRRLPDPTAYIPLGADHRYKGGKPITRQALATAGGLKAAIDDNMLDIVFKVTGFETITFDSMGNAIAETSDGDRFSRRQLDAFRRMARGKRFFISRIRAIGPDGSERSLSPMEITIN